MSTGTPTEGEHDFESAFTTAAAEAATPTTPATPATPPVQAAPAQASPQPPATAPAPTPPPAAETPPQLSALARAAQTAGLQFEGLSDEQIAQSMSDQIVRSRPYATYGQQMAPYADQIREYFERGAPQPQQTPGICGC